MRWCFGVLLPRLLVSPWCVCKPLSMGLQAVVWWICTVSYQSRVCVCVCAVASCALLCPDNGRPLTCDSGLYGGRVTLEPCGTTAWLFACASSNGQTTQCPVLSFGMIHALLQLQLLCSTHGPSYCELIVSTTLVPAALAGTITMTGC